jgi:AcrR family transcriptional regulator
MIMENNVDRRVRKTKKFLKEALCTLMKEKPLKDITIKDITDIADLNRSTFYLHYTDIEDLLENTEDDFIEGIKKIIEVYSLGELKNNKNNELFVKRFTISVFDYLKENYDISYVLFNHSDSSFIEKMKKIMIARMLVKKNKSGSEEEAIQIEYKTTFITEGNIGVIKKWLNSKNNFSSEQMADMVMSFM